jgi:RNA polymerase sigma-70 factor (ECF subfamily)
MRSAVFPPPTIGQDGITVTTSPVQANDDLETLLEQHRVELTGYCYRMLGSAFEAEDAVQETLVAMR